MGQSQRSFDQVKSILGKLDRNIDAARSRRLQDHTTPPATTPQPSAPVLQPVPALIPSPVPTAPAAAPAPGRSPFGRAQPMRLTRPNPMTGT
jgi:hypothetical protein